MSFAIAISSLKICVCSRISNSPSFKCTKNLGPSLLDVVNCTLLGKVTKHDFLHHGNLTHDYMTVLLQRKPLKGFQGAMLIGYTSPPDQSDPPPRPKRPKTHREIESIFGSNV